MKGLTLTGNVFSTDEISLKKTAIFIEMSRSWIESVC